MELHDLFQDKANKAAFLSAFEKWYANSARDLDAYKKDPEPHYFSLKKNEFGKLKVETTESSVSKLAKAIKRMNQPSNRPSDPKARLTAVLNNVAAKLDDYLQGIEKVYGYKNYQFGNNARIKIECLPQIQKAALFVHADIVRELLADENVVVGFRGPKEVTPAWQQEQQVAPAVQQG